MALTDLPEQDSITAVIMEEPADDLRWDELFSRSPDLFAQLAAIVMAEHHAGKTQGNHSFPPPMEGKL
jgi:hypothetical protein